MLIRLRDGDIVRIAVTDNDLDISTMIREGVELEPSTGEDHPFTMYRQPDGIDVLEEDENDTRAERRVYA